MSFQKIILTSVLALAILSFSQKGLSRNDPKPKTFTQAKVTFLVNKEPIYVEYAEANAGRCLVPVGSEIWVLSKMRTDVFAQLKVGGKSPANYSSPCDDGAVVRITEDVLVDMYNENAEANGDPVIAMDENPSNNSLADGD
jgi:hypothetical protein